MDTISDFFLILLYLLYLLVIYGWPVLLALALLVIISRLLDKRRNSTQPTATTPPGPLENLLVALARIVAVIAFIFYSLIEVKNWLIGKWKNRS